MFSTKTRPLRRNYMSNLDLVVGNTICFFSFSCIKGGNAFQAKSDFTKSSVGQEKPKKASMPFISLCFFLFFFFLSFLF